MQLIIVVAYSKNRVIGYHGIIPWNIPGDLAHFKKKTSNSMVIMGRKTWDSLKKPLIGRTNIVLTQNRELRSFDNEVLFFHSLQKALSFCSEINQVFIIGGERIYQQCIPMTQTIFATEIQAHVEGDTFFPRLDSSEWNEISRESKRESGYNYDFVEYGRYMKN